MTRRKEAEKQYKLQLADTTDERSNAKENMDNLWQQARRLPASQYTALWLRYAEDMSVREVAGVMGKTQVYVKVLLYRGRKRLGEVLQSGQIIDETTINNTKPLLYSKV